MEIKSPQVLDVEGYASLIDRDQQILIFDDVHLISPRHEGAFSKSVQGFRRTQHSVYAPW